MTPRQHHAKQKGPLPWRTWLHKASDIFSTLLRSLRLHLITAITSLRGDEEPKVALHRNRTVSAVHALVHLPPLVGAVVLLIWNIRGHYVGVLSTIVTSLQFVAKLF